VLSEVASAWKQEMYRLVVQLTCFMHAGIITSLLVLGMHMSRSPTNNIFAMHPAELDNSMELVEMLLVWQSEHT
jgi:hypothetical protein